MSEDLNTPEGCLRYIHSQLRKLSQVEHDYEAWARQADPSDEATLVKMHKRKERLGDDTTDVIVEVMKRRATLKGA